MSEGLCNIYTFNIFCPDLILNTKAKIRIASAVTSFSLEVHKIDSVFTGVLPTTIHHRLLFALYLEYNIQRLH